VFSFTDSEQPIQLYHIGSNSVQCFRLTPHKELKSYIYYYWWLNVLPGNTTLEVIPDNATDLVMSPEIRDFSILYLPSTEKFAIPLTGPTTYVGISFNAAAAARFFNLSLEAMSQCSPGEDTTNTLMVSEFVDGIQNLKHPEQLAPVLDNLAAARLLKKPLPTADRFKLNIDKALAAMQASVGARGMESVAEHFGLSDRQFRRVMASLFGYGPKKVQRVMRLQAALNEILTTDAAKLDDGFFDEAHKIKELRALTGLTPGQLRKMAEIYNSLP